MPLCCVIIDENFDDSSANQTVLPTVDFVNITSIYGLRFGEKVFIIFLLQITYLRDNFTI